MDEAMSVFHTKWSPLQVLPNTKSILENTCLSHILSMIEGIKAWPDDLSSFSWSWGLTPSPTMCKSTSFRSILLVGLLALLECSGPASVTLSHKAGDYQLTDTWPLMMTSSEKRTLTGLDFNLAFFAALINADLGDWKKTKHFIWLLEIQCKLVLAAF